VTGGSTALPNRSCHRICCVVSSLEAGGAQRVISILANGWAKAGREVQVITLGSITKDAYELDPRVARVDLTLEKDSQSVLEALTSNVSKIAGLRGAISRLAPDVVVSFVDRINVLTILACFGSRIPVIVSERVHPAHHRIGAIWSLLRRITYRLAHALVVQSEAMQTWANRTVRRSSIHVIPNPVGEQFRTSSQNVVTRLPIVLAIGRLVPQKGFDLLIKAFGLVADRHPEWSLVIAGRGSEESALRRTAARVLPTRAVSFLGSIQHPENYYRIAEILVVPSRFEGFPNVLIEGMAAGCAVIATDCPGATRDIVNDKTNGLLVPPEDVRGLAKALDELMEDPDCRHRLAARAMDVSGRFDLVRIMERWEEVFAAVCHNRSQELR
jgi:glycosyltransferase involved in cell wall biosynthesis